MLVPLGLSMIMEDISTLTLSLLMLDTPHPFLALIFFAVCTPLETISFACKDAPGLGGCFCPHALYLSEHTGSQNQILSISTI